MNHIRIINKGKRPWDLGCPHCNFLEWQAKKASEKTDPAKTAEKIKPKTKKAIATKKKATTEAQAKGDGLVNVPGIGPKTLEKLALAGIKTVADLAQAKAGSLAKMTGISPKKILAWQEAAGAMS
jgi:DNA topoisomerase-1